eukprot:TRINITY_DN62383_c0_g1_i1.p1 TRINITY_DN62383_c0_g1~~TRINITY_DN62383_c0_g1_i1.p1  ORF type:complete len:302 (+),score=66.64 TRINITY_DN62383_c0_g1_i1:112-1017(+)
MQLPAVLLAAAAGGGAMPGEPTALHIGGSHIEFGNVPGLASRVARSLGLQSPLGAPLLEAQSGRTLSVAAQTAAVRRALSRRGWSLLVLQEQPAAAGLPAAESSHAAGLAALAGDFAAAAAARDAAVILVEPWARVAPEGEHRRLSGGRWHDYASMAGAISQGTRRYATALQAAGVRSVGVAPCGTAFALARGEAAARLPGGFAARLHRRDGDHATELGAYLCATAVVLAAARLSGEGPALTEQLRLAAAGGGPLWRPPAGRVAPRDASGCAALVLQLAEGAGAGGGESAAAAWAEPALEL